MNSAFHRVTRVAALPVALSTSLLLLASCSSVEMPKVPGITPYRMVIQQGNFISQEMVSQLKPGMTREQVRFILGTPLVADIFHADRWDYVFFRETYGKKEQRNLSVVFEKDRLARVIGDLMPAEAAAPQTTGFKSQLKSDAPADAKPADAKPADAKPAAKPAAEPGNAAAAPAASTPAPEAVKPAPEAVKPAETWEPTKQNWGSAPPPPTEAQKAPAAQEAKASEDKTPEEQKPAEERGFFGRMLEKIGL